MCFDKKSSSSSSQTTNTTNRDERVAADNGARVVSFKDIGAAENSTLDLTLEEVSPDVLDRVFAYTQAFGQGALDFVNQTQSSYQQAASEAATQDTTELMRQLMTMGALVVVAYFAFQVWGK